MNNNDGKELVRLHGPPEEIRQSKPPRKKDWLDYVGEFLSDGKDEWKRNDPNLNLRQQATRDWARIKSDPKDFLKEAAPLLLLLTVGSACVLDVNGWSVNKISAKFMHGVPGGEFASELILKATVPASRTKPGETSEETARRRACIEYKLFEYGSCPPDPKTVRGSADVRPVSRDEINIDGTIKAKTR